MYYEPKKLLTKGFYFTSRQAAQQDNWLNHKLNSSVVLHKQFNNLWYDIKSDKRWFLCFVAYDCIFYIPVTMK